MPSEWAEPMCAKVLQALCPIVCRVVQKYKFKPVIRSFYMKKYDFLYEKAIFSSNRLEVSTKRLTFATAIRDNRTLLQ